MCGCRCGMDACVCVTVCDIRIYVCMLCIST